MSEGALQRAESLFDQGDVKGARELLREALAAEPTYDLLCAAGVVAHADGDVHDAKSCLLRAIELDGAQPVAYQHLGELMAAEGQYDRAEFWLAQAHQVAPDKTEALNALVAVYQDAGLIFSAKQTARKSLEVDPSQSALARDLAEMDAIFPDQPVTVYVPCFNAAKYVDGVIQAILAQSYPLTELLIIDDGSTDETVELAARYPVRIVKQPCNKGLSEARNLALAACGTPFLANLDADVLPDNHWLERLMLQFESARLNEQAGTGLTPLGGVMGRLDELHDTTLPDQWRAVHMGQHHGDEPKPDVPHLYGCNGLWLKDALMRAGGHDPLYKTNGEDCDCSDRVHGQGYRLAYEPAARCRHLRRDTLESVLRTIWRYHTPYYEYRYGLFSTGDIADVMKKLPENKSRFEVDWNTDWERRSLHLLYITFLGLPWRVLSDLKLAAENWPADRKRVAEETQAAIYLGMFALLSECELRDDLLPMIAEDLAPCLPASDEVRSLCAWDKVEQVIAANRDGSGPNPIAELTQRDPTAVGQCLRVMGEIWGSQDQNAWNVIRASALRLRHEQAEAESQPTGGLRVAVVNAPWAVDGRVGVRAGSRWPFTQDVHGQRVPSYVPFPFFLATATAMSKRAGFETIIVDAIAEGLYAEEFLRRLEGWQPDVILMETATASHAIDLDWCLQYKERLGDVKVMLCGPHASAIHTALMDEAPQVDAIVLGEFEPSFVDVLEAMRDGRSFEGIPGLLYRDENGQTVAQMERRKLPPMEFFPWPERMSLPMFNYFDSFANAMPWPNVQMHASRGCPFKCIFCVWPQVVYDGQQYRTRDNADIVAEMEWLLDQFGFQAVYFDDDTFNIDNERIIDLCNRIEASPKIDVPLCAMGRADTSSKEAFEAMKRAGLVGIKFGVETGDVDMMKRIKKHLDLNKVKTAVEWCKELEIGVHLTFSFGGPQETRETAQKTIDLAIALDPDTVQFSLMTPFPGTSMFEDAIGKGTLLTTDWSQFDGARYTVVKGEYLTREELEETLREAHRRWLLHTAERAVVQGCFSEKPTARGTASVDELHNVADGSLTLLQLTTPLERVANPIAVLSQARAKLARDGVLVALRSGGESLPAGWRDQPLTDYAGSPGIECLGQINGFNGELALCLRRKESVFV